MKNMRIAFVSILFSLAAAPAFSQDSTQVSGAPGPPVKNLLLTVITARYDVSAHSLNDVGALKDDLFQFEGKITSVEFDEKLMILKIKYSELMLEEEMVEVFKKHKFNFYSKL